MVRGIMEKESLRRNRGEGIMEEQSDILTVRGEETSGVHLGAIWEASGMDLGD